MPHPLVLQLRFTRSEWLRALDFVGNIDDEAPYTPHPADSTLGAS
jgi:hypothetical protein